MKNKATSLRTCDDRSCRFRRITDNGIRCAVEVTRKCNLFCPHCFVARDQQTLPLEALFQVLQQLPDVNCKKVIVTGGEPLVRQDLESIIEACAAQGMIVDLNSNLVALSVNRAKDLVKAGITEASVSLYGNETVHDRFVNCRGAFKKTINGIKTLRELGIVVDIHCALGSHNLTQVDDIINLCESLDCASLTFFTILPIAAKNTATQDGWKPGKRVHDQIRDSCEQFSFPVRTIGLVDHNPDECVMGASIIGLTADMELKPCLLADSCGSSNIDLSRVGLTKALNHLCREVSLGMWIPRCN